MVRRWKIGGLSPNSPATAAVCLGLLLLPLFVRPAASSVWDANEAFYVQTPREMVESGDWLRPTFNGRPRLNKPPLSYWVVAVPYRLFGVHLVWERLVMAVAAAGSVLLVFLLGRQLLPNPAAALLAAALFATTFRFLIVSRRLLIDTLLLLFILAATVAFVHWVRSGRRTPFLLMCLFLGLGFLAKGPVAWLPIPLFAFYLLRMERRDRPGGAPWMLGGLILGAVSGSWFLLLGFFHGWDAVTAFLLEENVGRYLTVDFGPRRGAFYYFGVLLGDFLPWSILLPAAMWTGFRRPGPGRTERVYLIAWILFVFVAFSFSLNKQEYYILPLYPAAALLIAGCAARGGLPLWAARAAALPLPAVGALFVLAGLTLFPSPWWVFPPPLFLVAAAVLLWRSKVLPAALLLSGFYSLSLFFASPALEAYKPVAALADTLRRRAELSGVDDYRAGYFRYTAPSLRFYLDRDILESYDADEAAAFLEDGGTAFLLTDEAGLAELRERLPELEVVDRRPRLRTSLRRLLESRRADDVGRLLTSEVYLLRNENPPMHTAVDEAAGP